jgi:beta-lactam-binding protein with PASTA domain
MTREELEEKFPGLYRNENNNENTTPSVPPNVPEDSVTAEVKPKKTKRKLGLGRNKKETIEAVENNSIISEESGFEADTPAPEKLDKKIKRNGFKQYLVVTLIYLISMYIIFLVVNNFVIPPIVHSRPLVEVPNIVGMTEEQAREKLLMKKIDFEIVSEQYNTDYKPGLIIKQTPKAGDMVKEQRPVYLTLSRGSRLVEVPNIRGMSYRKANITLMNAHLEFGKVDSVNSEEYKANTIIEQTPKARTQMKLGSKVHITLSIGSENTVIVPELVGYSLEGVYQYVEENGLHLGNIVYEINELYDSRTIISQTPAAGDTVQQGSSINLIIAQ